MDLDYLDRRRREELERASIARSDSARTAQLALAAAYAVRIARPADAPAGTRAAA